MSGKKHELVLGFSFTNSEEKRRIQDTAQQDSSASQRKRENNAQS